MPDVLLGLICVPQLVLQSYEQTMLVGMPAKNIFSSQYRLFSLTLFFNDFLSSAAVFFSKSTFSKNYFRITITEYQTIWIQIRLNVLLGLIWVQTVCKDFQQSTVAHAIKAFFFSQYRF